MDTDTRDAFDALRSDVRAVDNHMVALDHRVVALDNRVAGLENRVVALDGRVVVLGESITAVDDRLTTVEQRLRQEIREEAMTTRRHFDVVAESLRDDIRLIAEGLVALAAKVDGMRRA